MSLINLLQILYANEQQEPFFSKFVILLKAGVSVDSRTRLSGRPSADGSQAELKYKNNYGSSSVVVRRLTDPKSEEKIIKAGVAQW